MADATVVKPDLDFVKGIIAAGGESLKKCYQCATCSVVCNVTPDETPFPRKEMIWAQWGLKEKFIGNPDVWLCYQCNDCTVYCPRGAKPGEVLGAIRKQTIQQYSVPGFMVDLVNKKSFVFFLFLIPAIILGLIISATGNWSPAPDPEKGIMFSNFMGILPIQIAFTPALIFGVVIGALGLKKFWADMKTANSVASGDLKGSVIDTVKEIMSHDRFKKCDVSGDRYISHFLVMYSFISLGIATGLGVVYIDFLGLESPFSFGYGTPIKIFGNLGAIAIIAGIILMINNRFKNAEKAGLGSYYDWLLIGTIGVVGISGFLAQILRIAGVGSLAYMTYFVHLVAVFALFIYLPYSKLAHMFYRGAALAFLKYSGRESKSQEQSSITQSGSEPKQESGQE